MSRIGRRYKLAAVATLFLLLAVPITALYDAWQVAVTVLALLVGTSIALTIESRFRHGSNSYVLVDVRRSLAEIQSVLAESERTHEQTMEAISSVHRDVSEQLSSTRDAIRRDLSASFIESEKAHERTRETVTSALLEASEQESRGQESIRHEIQHARKLEGERHARTRKALAGLMSIETTIRDQSAALLTGVDTKERRLLGVLEAERVRLHDRHHELMHLLSTRHASEEKDTSA